MSFEGTDGLVEKSLDDLAFEHEIKADILRAVSGCSREQAASLLAECLAQLRAPPAPRVVFVASSNSPPPSGSRLYSQAQRLDDIVAVMRKSPDRIWRNVDISKALTYTINRGYLCALMKQAADNKMIVRLAAGQYVLPEARNIEVA